MLTLFLQISVVFPDAFEGYARFRCFVPSSRISLPAFTSDRFCFDAAARLLSLTLYGLTRTSFALLFFVVVVVVSIRCLSISFRYSRTKDD